MRIVLISYSGLADYTIALANALSKKDEVMLVLSKRMARPFINSVDKSIKKFLIEFPRMRNPLNLFYAIKLYYQIKEFNPRVIHFQAGFLWFTFLLPWLKRWPIVTTIHDVVPHQGDRYSRKMKWFFPNTVALYFSAKLIVHGEHIKNKLIASSNVSCEKIIHITHGDGFLYKQNNPNEKTREHNRILFFGRILEYKGLSYLIKAQPLISHEIPDLKICIAGEGDLLKYEDLFVDKNCFEIYNHFIQSDLMAKLFQSSSLVVLPYNEASQSGVVSIAYSFAKPVVATDVGCLPEIVEHGKTGLIVPPRNEKELAEVIIHLLQNKKKLYQMGKNAYQKVVTEMSWEKVAELTRKLYLSVSKY